MVTNRNQLAAIGTRIDMLETQLARGRRKIIEAMIDRFAGMLSAKLRDDDPTLRASYLGMFVSEVRVSDSDIVISGPTSALEAGVATGLPHNGDKVPSFDQQWCRLQDSNLWPHHYE